MTYPRFSGRFVLSVFAATLFPVAVRGADVTFNVTLVGESDPFSGTRAYADVWGYGNYAYVGSDAKGVGVTIFNISTPTAPQYVTTYPGSKMQDLVVYNGIGYFGSNDGYGVDIVDLSDPGHPVQLSRVDSSIGGHNLVHDLSVDNGFLYTADLLNDEVRVFNVTDPSNPRFVANIGLGAPAGIATHDTTVINGRMYVSSMSASTNKDGWTHIYDISNIGTTGAVLLKAFTSGSKTHSNWPTENHQFLYVTTEKGDGTVEGYDISMINQSNDPDSPVLRKTLDRTGVGIDATSPHDPVVRGNLLFVSWFEAGIQVFNIADPSNPVHVGAFDTYPGTTNQFAGAWAVDPFSSLDRVLIGDRERGLIIVDATGVLSPGDYDQTGVVDSRDYDTWRTVVGTNNSAADGNRNGIVDAADYVIWRKNLGQTLPPLLRAGTSNNSATVLPEPATVLLLAIGIAAVFPKQRKWQREDLRAIAGGSVTSAREE